MKEIFEQVKVTAWRRYTDENGKRKTHQKTFWATINPFNKNPDGTPKSYGQVYADVEAEAKAWKKARS